MQQLSDAARNARSILMTGLLALFLGACGGGSDRDPVDSGGSPGADSSGGQGGDDSGGDDGNDNEGGDEGGDSGDSGNDTEDDDGNAGGGLAFDTFQPAAFVIGQQDLTGGEPDQGGSAPGANTLDKPMGHAEYSAEHDVMFIADAGNARVLGYLGVPDVNNANADFVLGQPDFTSSSRTTISAADMYSPEWVTTMEGRLAITDTDLNRVTVYEGFPQSGDALPVRVIGQESPDTFSGACDASTLIHPHAQLLLPDGKVVVADAANHRVLVWNEMPAEDGAPADFVLGQSSFTNCSFREPGNFRHPSAMWSDGKRFILADSEKHRVLIWNTFPTESFQPPDVILGQSAMAFAAPNDDNQDGEPDGNFELVEGEDNIASLTANGDATARTLSYPRDVEVHDGKLYVADLNNHRVLIWNRIPTESFTPADNVLGQPDFVSNAPNGGEAGTNARGFQRPVGVNVIDGRLFVTDWDNSRVVAFEGQRNE